MGGREEGGGGERKEDTVDLTKNSHNTTYKTSTTVKIFSKILTSKVKKIARSKFSCQQFY